MASIMVIRLWVVVSLVWSSVFAYMFSLNGDVLRDPAILVFTFSPWIIGPFVYFAARWIFTGQLTRR